MVQNTNTSLTGVISTRQELKTKLKPIFTALQRFTTIDDDGRLSAIFFTGGCGFRCVYCHNPQFVLPELIEFLPIDKFTSFLEKRVGVLESVVICGGEPAIHSNMIEWLRFIKSLGYRVKFDTNGMYPNTVKGFISEGLVDFFAIDYKSPLNDYFSITQKKYEYKNVIKTIHLILNNNVELEIRSTIHPEYHTDANIKKMIEEVSSLGCKSYYLQRFVDTGKTLANLKPTSNKLDLNVYLPLLKSKFIKYGIRN